MVYGEKIDFFTTKNVGRNSIVQLVDEVGDVIFEELTNGGFKYVTAFFIVRRSTQAPAKLEKLFQGFVDAMNNAIWNGKKLNHQVKARTPNHFILPQAGIGYHVGQHGCKTLVEKFWDDFMPHTRWGKDKKDLLRAFWNPGAWTLDNATYFGAPLSWLTQAEREKYNAQLLARNEADI